jgi:hypothetical protein
MIIVHFRKKSLYPPVLNLNRFLCDNCINSKIIDGDIIKSHNDNNIVMRKLVLYLNLFFFTLKSFSFILFDRKEPVIYFESISAIPIWLYYFLFPFSRNNLFIHYHEYYSQDEYSNYSFFERLGRRLEIKLFERASWISHTNQDRLRLFHKEFPYLSDSVLKTMPNYPPQSWLNQDYPGRDNKEIIKLVHIGSLSLEGMYLKEVLNHFGSQPKYSIDFYSHNFTKEVKEAIQLHDNCTVHGSIYYHDLPKLKGLYDVGLVLYKGLSLNFTYNAPNKIFEYLALNLDVWCSHKLVTAKKYVRIDCYPKMLIVDFEKLDEFDYKKALDKKDLSYVPSPYICEPIYGKLLKAINENTHS